MNLSATTIPLSFPLKIILIVPLYSFVHILSLPIMDLVMLMHGPQAGLFSAVLTAFVLDSKQDLKPSPADETVYYLQQHSTILYQISVQLSSIAPQVSIP